jgi:hypothetical protein
MQLRTKKQKMPLSHTLKLIASRVRKKLTKIARSIEKSSPSSSPSRLQK